LRKLRAMLPDDLKDRIQQLPQRTWIYLDGKTNPEIRIEPFKKEGKPTMLKPTTPQPQKPKKRTFREWLAGLWVGKDVRTGQRPEPERESDESESLEADSSEDSEGDGLMSEGDIMFPEE